MQTLEILSTVPLSPYPSSAVKRDHTTDSSVHTLHGHVAGRRGELGPAPVIPVTKIIPTKCVKSAVLKNQESYGSPVDHGT